MVHTSLAKHTPEIQSNIKVLLQRLGIETSSIAPYILAFTHRSIVNERPDFTPEHNERLEFLWDAVIELVITNALYDEFPEMPEWDMTDLRSALVRGRNLAEVAKKLDFQDYLLLGKWEEKSWWRENEYLLANTLEAFIWAMYKDIWLAPTRDFIIQHIYSTLPHILKNGLSKDFKTLLQENAQANHDITPHYTVLSETWPDHDKQFQVGVYLWDKKIGEGKGSSKKKAQENAAQNAYNDITS